MFSLQVSTLYAFIYTGENKSIDYAPCTMHHVSFWSLEMVSSASQLRNSLQIQRYMLKDNVIKPVRQMADDYYNTSTSNLCKR